VHKTGTGKAAFAIQLYINYRIVGSSKKAKQIRALVVTLQENWLSKLDKVLTLMQKIHQQHN
jgi:hypothetical protein